MNRLTILVAMGLFATAAFAGPGGGGMHATPTARPAASTTHTTTTAKPTTNTAGPSSRAATSGGQPSASCESVSPANPPGNSSTARGSAFADGGVAGGKYAGQQPQNSINPKSVSQYDVACTRNHSH